MILEIFDELGETGEEVIEGRLLVFFEVWCEGEVEFLEFFAVGLAIIGCDVAVAIRLVRVLDMI